MMQEKKPSQQDTKDSQNAAVSSHKPAGTETKPSSSSDRSSTHKEKISSHLPGKQKTSAPSYKKSGACRQCTGWLIILILLLAVAFAGGGYWFWLQIQVLHDRVGQVDTQMRQETADLNQKLSRTLEKSQLTGGILKEVQASLENANNRQTRLQEAVQALHAEVNKGRFQGWRVSETRYLMHIASDRLYLARDVDGAILALKAADQRLREVGDPSLLAVRSALADEIGQLQIVPKIDFAGVSTQLISLQKRVGDLALLSPRIKQDSSTEGVEQKRTTTAGNESSHMQQVGQRFIDSLRDLVKIRHKDGQEIQFLPVDQRVYLSQNMRLKLEVARLSLLQRDDTLFHQSLTTVLDWLKQYYRQDTVYQALEHQIQDLQKIRLIFQAPDISGSGKLLQAWLQRQETQLHQKALPEPPSVGEAQ